MCVVFYLFFFFKQKTAYEMRISDWSSDVCSSDLQSGEHGDKEVHVSQAPRLRDVAERAGVSVSLVSAFINRPDQVSKKTSLRIEEAIRELRFVPNDAARQLRRGSSRLLAFVALEIGRATCRERVCQYV